MNKRKLSQLLTLLSIGLFLLSSFEGRAQLNEFLLLEKPGKAKKRIRYYIGDEILFKLEGDKVFQKAVIVQFTDSSFYVDRYVEIPLSSVSAIADRSKVDGVHALAKNTFYAIPAFFLFSGANNLFNTGEQPIIDREVYSLSAIFASIGALGLLYNGRQYRLSNQWRIIMVRH